MALNRILCVLSGDDYSIIRQCSQAIQNRFMAIGAFVALIFLLCFCSSYISFTMLFQNYFIGIPIALFFAWMITNIYLLLLYTLSPNSFPSKISKTARRISILIRALFICFIAIIISKPIESVFFSKGLSIKIDSYKQKQIEKYTASTTAYFDEETQNIRLIMLKEAREHQLNKANQPTQYASLLQEKEQQKAAALASMQQVIEDSNYYIKRISMLNSTYPACWLITLLTILVFLCPAYLKNRRIQNDPYYATKKAIESRIVQEEYARFKLKYRQLIRKYTEEEVAFSEPFENPPFNTIRKKSNYELRKEEDLIAELYNV